MLFKSPTVQKLAVAIDAAVADAQEAVEPKVEIQRQGQVKPEQNDQADNNEIEEIEW